jgi:hypothetical protein
MPAKKSVLDAPERLKKSLPKLQAAAAKLNEASDHLNESAERFNTALRPMGLGISSWFQFSGDQDNDHGFFWSEEIGYTKLSTGKWGLALRSTRGEFNSEPDVDTWAFKDAPRSLRVKAAPYIPDLLEQLIEDVARTTKEVVEHSSYIESLTETILDLPPATQEES